MISPQVVGGGGGDLKVSRATSDDQFRVVNAAAFYPIHQVAPYECLGAGLEVSRATSDDQHDQYQHEHGQDELLQ